MRALALILTCSLGLLAQTPGPQPPTPLPDLATRLNQEGVALYEKRDFDGAIARFEQARVQDPKSDVLITNLARALHARGVERSGKKRFGDALQDLRRARELRPAEVPIGLSLSHALSAQGETWKQRRLLHEMLEAHPADARIFEALGRLEYAEENLDKALELFEAGARLDPERAKAKSFVAFLEKVRREAKVEGRYFLEERGIFRVKYDDETFRAISQQVLDILDRHTNRLSSELQVTPRRRIIVVLYTRKDYDQATGAHGWTGGLFDGTKIRLPVKNFRQAAQRIDSTLAHELSHLFVREITRRCPLWLDEGLAQLSEGRKASSVRSILRTAVNEKKLQSMASLPRSWTGIKSRERVQRYYAQALSFTDWLQRRYGNLTVTRFLQKLGNNRKPWTEVFEQVFQRELAELEADWRVDL